MPAPKNIVIIGGGFAGATLARALKRRLPAEHQIVLISEESHTTFNPRLAEGVGASVFRDHVVAPICQMHDGDRLLPELPATLGHAAAQSLSSRGLVVRLQAHAARVSADITLSRFTRSAESEPASAPASGSTVAAGVTPIAP